MELLGGYHLINESKRYSGEDFLAHATQWLNNSCKSEHSSKRSKGMTLIKDQSGEIVSPSRFRQSFSFKEASTGCRTPNPTISDDEITIEDSASHVRKDFSGK